MSESSTTLISGVHLRRYVGFVALFGPISALAIFGLLPHAFGMQDLLLALLFVIAAAIAERSALRLTHHTHISVATSIYVAMLWLLPIGWVGVIAFVAVVASELSRYEPGRPLFGIESLFNSGQSAMYVSTGAVIFAVLDALLDGRGGSTAGILMMVLAGIVIHLTNTFLVSTAGAIQTQVSPLQAWGVNIMIDLRPHAVMIAFGATAALALSVEPWVLPAIVLPFALTHLAVGQSIALREEERTALAALVDIVELRDPYTAGHSRRVAQTARALSRKLGKTEEEADLIESAGRVHDLGKVAVDPNVLLKTGKLNDDEWTQMQLHPIYGADVVKAFSAYEHGVRLVRHHHERWDGKGYPDGIAGEAIPFGARVLAVADTFDALTSDRPYRKGMSIEKAVAILREGSGSQWNSAVVEALIAILAESPELIPLFQQPEEPIGIEVPGTAA